MRKTIALGRKANHVYYDAALAELERMQTPTTDPARRVLRDSNKSRGIK